MEKKERLGILKRLVEEGLCHDQQELIEAMKAEGCDVTQSTLSRDMSTLGIKKERLSKGNYRYTIAQKDGYVRVHETHIDPKEEKHWYVMFTRIYKERQTTDELLSQGIEAWIPEQIVKKRWSDRIKTTKKTVISRIVFVHCGEQTRLRRSFVTYTLGYMSDKVTHTPVIIPDKQMRDFQTVITQSDNDVIFTEEQLQPGQKVRIVFGNLAGVEAELLEIKEQQTNVIVRINNLGCACIKISLDMLEPITENK